MAKATGYEQVQLKAIYGVVEEPFRSSGEFFTGGGRQALLDELRHQVHFSERMLVLTGERGAGKTRLLRELMSKEQEALTILTVDADRTHHTQALAESLIGQLSRQQLAAQPSGEADAATFLRLAETQYSQGMRTLVLIDNAQQLSDHALRWLIEEVIVPGHEQVGVLIAGGSELVSVLQRLPESLVIGHVRQMPLQPFSLEDTRAYVAFRLSRAGWPGKPALSAALIERLYASTRGLPGRIAKLAPAILTGGASGEQVKRDLVRSRWINGLALGLALGAVGYVLWRYTHLPDPSVQSIQAVGAPETAGVPTGSVAVEMPVDVLHNQDEQAERGQTEPGTQEQGIREPVSAELAKAEPATVERVVSKQVADASKKVVSASRDASALRPQQGEAGEPQRPQAGKAANDAPVPAEQAQVAQAAGEKRSVGASKAASVTRDHTSEPGTAQWLRAQDPNAAAIQLSGVSDRRSAEAFAKKWSELAPVYVVATRWKNRDWYVVLQGRYPSRDEARKALQTLPAPLRRAGAWVRTFASVQASLKE